MDTVIQWVMEPLRYEFMVRALWMSATVGLVCAVLSCYMILKGWSLMGDAVSHAVLPGVVFAYILGVPFSVGAFVSGFIAVLVIGYVKRQTHIKEDAVMGIVFTGFFALGLVLISVTPSAVDLTHILFGNILGISTTDMWQTLVIGGFTFVAVMVLRKDLLLFCFDENQARAIGLNTTFLYYALLSLLSLTIVAALQTVGIILVISMLITPGAIGHMLTDRFNRMMWIAAGVSVASAVFGTYLSYYLNASTGGCIVIFQVAIFVLTLIFAPKRGMIGRWLLARRERAVATQGLEGSAHHVGDAAGEAGRGR
jgi:manganese transport system permease protein